MAETLVALAALLACVPALLGSHTACALLVSYAYALALEHLGVAFWGPQWLVADLFVLKVILAPRMSLADELIGALMVLAWFGYLMGEWMNYQVGCGIVAMQFFIATAAPMRRPRHA